VSATFDYTGIIGVGLVGTALAERFLAGGLRVVGFDIDAGRNEQLKQLGGRVAASAAEVARQSRRIVLSLPTSAIAGAVLDEIEPQLAPGTIVIDTTTGAPEDIAGFGERLAARGVPYLDATIGGSSRQVREGDVIVLCGGERAAFDACQDLFAHFSKRTFHLGPCASGARMKLVLNLVLGLNRAVLAEGLTYAKARGIDPATALEVLRAGPAYSRVMDTKGAKMLNQEFSAEARLSQHLKDVRLILASAEQSGAWLPLSALHRELLEKAEAAGFGAADNSAIIKAFEREIR